MFSKPRTKLNSKTRRSQERYGTECLAGGCPVRRCLTCCSSCTYSRVLPLVGRSHARGTQPRGSCSRSAPRLELTTP
jgi:hypothetical protein